MLLQDLDRLGFRYADRRAPVGQSIGLPPAAIAAAGEEVHDIAAAAIRVPAAEREIAARAGRACKHALRHRLTHRPEHGLHDALGDLGRAAGDRAGILSIEERPLGNRNSQRREATGIDRDFGKDVLHRDIDRGLGRCPHAVHRTAAGRARAREVERDVAARDRHLERDRQRLIHHAVAVDIAGEAVHAVRDALDAGAHLALGAGLQLPDPLHRPSPDRNGRGAR